MEQRHPSFGEAWRFWLKLGFISFGGPAGQIAIMHTELVERRKWIGERRFLHALNFCMLLPGPEATQLARAPHIEQLRGNVRLSAALATVAAAVVGVVLNLAVWFAGHTLRPGAAIDWFAVAVAVVAFRALQRWKLSVATIVVLSGLVGLGWRMVAGG